MLSVQCGQQPTLVKVSLVDTSVTQQHQVNISQLVTADTSHDDQVSPAGPQCGSWSDLPPPQPGQHQGPQHQPPGQTGRVRGKAGVIQSPTQWSERQMLLKSNF